MKKLFAAAIMAAAALLNCVGVYAQGPEFQLSVEDEWFTYIESFTCSEGIIQNPGIKEDDTVLLMVNGEFIPEFAIIKASNALVPIRAVSDKLNWDISWEESSDTVTISGDSMIIVFTIGAETATVNGDSIGLSAPAQIINGKTYIPARFAGENLGASVSYSAKSEMEFYNVVCIDMPVSAEAVSADMALENFRVMAVKAYDNYLESKLSDRDREDDIYNWAREELANAFLVGEISRYYIVSTEEETYNGLPYPSYFIDKYTQDVYYYWGGYNSNFCIKINPDDTDSWIEAMYFVS